MRPLLFFVLLLTSPFTLGCGGPEGPEIATVTGTITMDDQPLAGAAVLFYPENGRPAGGETDENGNYTLEYTVGRDGAMPGKNIVRISTEKGEYDDDDGVFFPATPETIPAEYNAASTLEFMVEAGKVNVADFALTSGGEVLNESYDDDGEY